MRALNVFLAVLVSLAIALPILEGGLRLLKLGPQPNLLDFDSNTGWSNKPDASLARSNGEVTLRFETNSLGLRDDELPQTKPAGEYRVIAIGDSFTLGFGVDRADHFVDLLEEAWQAEGRPVTVLNAGVEGWDTAQQVAWLEAHAQQLQPDLVLLLPYENDLYWNGQTEYFTKGGARQKPRYSPGGERENPVLENLKRETWLEKFALTKWIPKPDRSGAEVHYEADGREKELAPLLSPKPAFAAEYEAHTLGALRALKRAAEAHGAAVVSAPIPPATLYQAPWREAYERTRTRRQGGRLLAGHDWDGNRPVDTFLALCAEAGIATVDVRPQLAAAAASGEPLYWTKDWHFNPHGSRVFAAALEAELPAAVIGFPAGGGEQVQIADHGNAPTGMPFWAKLYAGLWLALTALYFGTYRDEPLWQPPLKVAAILAAVFGLFLGLLALQKSLPAWIGGWLFPAFGIGVLGFVAYKLGKRLGTIAELLKAFILRGHWYLMPLVVVLVSIGSLLVVAASSPLVAPFIYTLF
ncbi:MAG TPA: DUF5989 family protein [Planctomycetota bacterium]|nr:DUF5989 family protein [Planctomycetota bacterium]